MACRLSFVSLIALALFFVRINFVLAATQTQIEEQCDAPSFLLQMGVGRAFNAVEVQRLASFGSRTKCFMRIEFSREFVQCGSVVADRINNLEAISNDKNIPAAVAAVNRALQSITRFGQLILGNDDIRDSARFVYIIDTNKKGIEKFKIVTFTRQKKINYTDFFEFLRNFESKYDELCSYSRSDDADFEQTTIQIGARYNEKFQAEKSKERTTVERYVSWCKTHNYKSYQFGEECCQQLLRGFLPLKGSDVGPRCPFFVDETK